MGAEGGQAALGLGAVGGGVRRVEAMGGLAVSMGGCGWVGGEAGGAGEEEHAVEGAADAEAASVEDVGVDHGGGDVGVAEELLDGADVVAALEEVGGEGVADGVAAGAFGEAGGEDGVVDGALEDRLVEVVAAPGGGGRVVVVAGGGEDPLPGPFAAGVGELAVEGVGEGDGAGAVGEVVEVLGLDLGEVRGSMRRRGSIVLRSFWPLPSRMRISPRSRSRSLTRRRQHSSRRRPEP